MLVLSRQRDETIMIGDDVEITVVDIRGDKVRIGINAPRHIQVHRKEVYDAIKRENQQAAKMAPGDLPEAMDRDRGTGGIEATNRRANSTDNGNNDQISRQGSNSAAGPGD